jgi:hypothetical protein
MDGVLFIDEAYDLDPNGDFKGKPIVSELLVRISSRFGSPISLTPGQGSAVERAKQRERGPTLRSK